MSLLTHLLTYLLTSWNRVLEKVTRFAASQEIPRILWNPKVHYRIQKNIRHTIKRRKANWIGHSWRGNCLLKDFIEEKIGMTGRGRRRRKQLLDDLEENMIL